MFWDNYYRLCAKEGKTPNKVAAELEISSGTVTGWKKGALPRPQVMQKLCDHFGVTKEQLIADEDAATSIEKTTRESLQTEDDPIVEDVLTYARAMVQTASGKKKLADITRFMRQSIELENLGKNIFNG